MTRKEKDRAQEKGGIGPRLKKAMDSKRMPKLTTPLHPVHRTLMMDPTRRRIFTTLCERPCISVGDVARSLGISRANADWHVSKLLGTDLLSRRRFGRRWVLFPTHLLDDDDIPLFSVLNNGVTRKAYLLIREAPDISQRELCEAMDLSRQVLAWHIRKLIRTGLVLAIKDGRLRRYRPTTMFDERAKGHGRKVGKFKGFLMKALEEDGTGPVVVKSLSRSFLVRLRSGRGTPVLEVRTDPFQWLLENEDR